MSQLAFRRSLLAIIVLCLSGCSLSLGPRSIPSARFDYNQAISRSWDEQLLLNLVRLRYIESPLFVDVTGITAAYTMGGQASLGRLRDLSGGGEFSLGLGMDLRESPVISYNYLQGEQFANRMLAPLTPDGLEPLARSGWAIERLLRCCVQRLGGIENDIAERERFGRVATLFGQLQSARQLRLRRDGDGRIYLDLPADSEVAAELRTLLGLSAGVRRVEVVDAASPAPGQLGLQGRSLLAAMYVLSYGVEVPESDHAKVAPLRDVSGEALDALALMSSLIHVRAGARLGPDAGVSVHARGRWYWVDDTDISSKNTLALLRMLLFLKAAERTTVAPVVTIPSR